MSFWHYYDVDSLTDSCIIQMTADSGNTWMDISYDNWIGAFQPYYSGSLFGTNLDWSTTNMLLFTGASNGWVQERICFAFNPVKSTNIIDVNFGYRFLFKSDSVDNGKSGWVIDDMQMIEPIFNESVSDVSNNPLSISPNPSSSGIYTLSYPEHFVQGSVIIYDVFGRKLKEQPLQKQIDLSALPAGIYLYRAKFKGYERGYTGRLLRQ